MQRTYDMGLHHYRPARHLKVRDSMLVDAWADAGDAPDLHSLALSARPPPPFFLLMPVSDCLR
jgi:hypothetical protein